MKDRINLFEWYFSKRTLPYWCVLALDCLIIFFSGLFVYWAFYRGAALQRNFCPLLNVMLIYILVSMVFIRLFSSTVIPASVSVSRICAIGKAYQTASA